MFYAEHNLDNDLDTYKNLNFLSDKDYIRGWERKSS